MVSVARELYDSLTWDVIERWVREGEPETLHLEFKRKQDANTAAIDHEDAANMAKALSAFANVEGGVCIVGVDAGAGERGGSSYDRARQLVLLAHAEAFGGALERRLRTFTDPPIAGLQCKMLSRSKGTPGVLAVYIPESDGGPHRATNATKQVNDRYYMRTAAGAQTMPHALLADRFGRTARPRLHAAIEFMAFKPNPGIRLTLLNTGRGAAIRPAVLLRKRPRDALLSWPTGQQASGFAGRTSSANDGTTILYEPAYGYDAVIYPDMAEHIVMAALPNAVLPRHDPGLELAFDLTIFALDVQPVSAQGTLVVPVDALEVPDEIEPLLLPKPKA